MEYPAGQLFLHRNTNWVCFLLLIIETFLVVNDSAGQIVLKWPNYTAGSGC